MSGEPVRLAVVGAGAMAHAYLDVLAGGDVGRVGQGAEVVAVVDTEPDRAVTVADRCDAVPLPHVDALVQCADSLGVDAALVCTPPSTHAETAVAALLGGLDVLCEKPFAPDRSGSHLMLQAALETGRTLLMASPFRYATDVARAKAIVDAGELGEVVLFRNAFTSIAPMRGRWHAVPEISGGGVISDRGTHAVDLARYLLGPIREVVAVESRRIQMLGVEDTAQILFRTGGGATGAIELSWSLDTGSPWYCTLDGTEGSIRLGWASAEQRDADGDWRTIGAGYSEAQALAALLGDFCRAVRDRTPPAITAADANASVAVVDAAYTSMRTRSWERVVEERRRRPRVA